MLDQVLVALDLEATGMEPGRDHIIEIGAVKFRAGQVLERFETFVRPEREISFSIQSLTGISNSDLKDAPTIRSVATKLETFMKGAPVVGQSVQMDVAMLTAAGLHVAGRAYDTFELATILIPELPTYNLATIAHALDVEVGGKHRAVVDAETSMVVFNRLVQRADQFDDATLERIADLTRQSRSQLSHVFRSLLRERRRDYAPASGTSIGAQLLAKLGGAESSGPEAMFLVPRDRADRLEAVEDAEPIDERVLDAAMAPDGPFARSMDAYEQREQQLDMMRAVTSNLNDGGQAIVEAGTGTGKSLGYLLPAALHAVAHGEPVVISTATIALQDQLVTKDIPALKRAAEEALPDGDEERLRELTSLRATVLKGRANYLCLRRWFLAQRDIPESAAEADLHTKVTAWLHHTETGDRAELRLSQEQQRYWHRLAEDEGACIPRQCIFHRRNQCFLFRARQQAEGSHLIIVNHSLLLSDLLRGGSVLPPFRHLVIDEAQHLESEATVQAGFSLSQSQASATLNRILSEQEPIGLAGALGLSFRAIMSVSGETGRSAAQTLQPYLTQAQTLVAEAHTQLDSVFSQLAAFVERYDHGASGYERRVRLTHAMRSDTAWTQIEIGWDDAVEPIDALAKILGQFSEQVQRLSDDDLPTRSEILNELELLTGDLAMLRERGLALLSQSASDLICWMSRHQTTGELSLHAAPLHVDELLKDELYRKLDSLTLTSATLSTEGSFSFIRERLGLEDAAGVQVPSPFDYEASTLVTVADDIPEPNQPGHQKHIQQALIEICKASRGRAMVLFTSHNSLQTSYHGIKRTLEADGILVLGQRIDGSPRQLLDRLGDHPETVLLGTNSFWEGVDIVGDALSVLIITRLPFSVPSDPIFAARSELFDNPFVEYAVPQAILRFKQGFGRLIRSRDDRGVAVVLDRRVVSRNYGRSFIDSLPEMHVEVAPFSRVARLVETWLLPERRNHQ